MRSLSPKVALSDLNMLFVDVSKFVQSEEIPYSQAGRSFVLWLKLTSLFLPFSFSFPFPFKNCNYWKKRIKKNWIEKKKKQGHSERRGGWKKQ